MIIDNNGINRNKVMYEKKLSNKKPCIESIAISCTQLYTFFVNLLHLKLFEIQSLLSSDVSLRIIIVERT